MSQKPRFAPRPPAEIRAELQRQREENGRKLKKAAPRLKTWLDEINTEPTEE